MAKSYTYDHTKVKQTLNFLPITDLAGPVTVTEDDEDWGLTKGLNGTAQFSKKNNITCTIQMPFISTSEQYIAVKGFRKLDNETGAGPFPYTFIDLNNGDTIIGSARIMSISARDNAEEATERTVTLRVIKHMDA